MHAVIERAKAGDEAALAHIHTESWKAAFAPILSPELLAAHTDPVHAEVMYRHLLAQSFGQGYLLKVEGKPHCLAWWRAARTQDKPGYAELICIHSLPDQWRRGYGRKMMQTVLQDIAAAGYSGVMLWVFEANVRARRFYEALGFTAQGERRSDFGPTELCYEKTW